MLAFPDGSLSMANWGINTNAHRCQDARGDEDPTPSGWRAWSAPCGGRLHGGKVRLSSTGSRERSGAMSFYMLSLFVDLQGTGLYQRYLFEAEVVEE
jgi:hypothetical protein